MTEETREQIIERRREWFKKNGFWILILFVFGIFVCTFFIMLYAKHTAQYPCEVCMKQFGMTCYKAAQTSNPFF